MFNLAKHMHKVSVIVPCYNQGDFLNDALGSVWEQGYQDWECVIVNDGSTDQSEQVALQWVNKDSRFKYFSIPNGGVSHARNFGISRSSGTYILPLDGDDKISPNYLEEAVKAISATGITLVYGVTKRFGAETGKWATTPYAFKTLLHQNLVPCTALYRKADFDKTSGYCEEMREGLEDWEFWLTLLDENSKVIKLDNIFLYYRRKTDSRSYEITKAHEAKMKRQIVKNHQQLYDRYLPDLITLYHERSYLEKSLLHFIARYYLHKWFRK